MLNLVHRSVDDERMSTYEPSAAPALEALVQQAVDDHDARTAAALAELGALVDPDPRTVPADRDAA